MTVWGIGMVRDEADIVEATIRHMAGQVDRLLVADNRSSDGTREILDQLAAELPLEVVDDGEIGYYQSRKMTDLGLRATDEGASWIVPFDADEIWQARAGRLADQLDELPAWAHIAQAALFDYVATGEDPPAPPLEAIQWRRSEATPLPKVAFRAEPGVTIHQGNHGASIPSTRTPGVAAGLLVVRHFPYRSVEQFEQKVRNGLEAYQATDLPPDAGAHWRDYGAILESQGPAALAEVFTTWFYRANPRKPIEIGDERQGPLVFDPL